MPLAFVVHVERHISTEQVNYLVLSACFQHDMCIVGFIPLVFKSVLATVSIPLEIEVILLGFLVSFILKFLKYCNI